MWRVWLILAGRGWGKTRTGAEWIRDRVRSGKAKHIALVGRTVTDVRKVMVQGKSGILNVFPRRERPIYKPALREITFVDRNRKPIATATTFTAEEPDLLRGPEHDTFWADELAAWKFPDAWDQLNFGLRIGDDPRGIITTTPRPSRIIRDLLKDDSTHTTRGSTYENRANVSKAWLQTILKKYEGTTLGRQELMAEILDEMPGALWSRMMLDASRVQFGGWPEHRRLTYEMYSLAPLPALQRIIIAVDPSVSSKDDADECGIATGGLGTDGESYTLQDLTKRCPPHEWAKIAVQAYRDLNADLIVAEANNGGDLVASTIRSIKLEDGFDGQNVPVKLIHAKKSKHSRAQPVSSFWEQKRSHHIGLFPDLEDEQCNYVPGVSKKSPNRMDANVYLHLELMENACLNVGPDTEGLTQESEWMSDNDDYDEES